MMLWIAGAVALVFIGYLIYDIFRAWQRKRRIENWRRRARAQQNLRARFSVVPSRYQEKD